MGRRFVHWQTVLSCAVGAWLVMSPLVLSLEGAAAAVSVVLGAAVIALSIEGLILPPFLEEWLEIAMGVALVVAPWSISYAASAAVYSSVASGIAILGLAGVEPGSPHG